jgi:hypothetical protein
VAVERRVRVGGALSLDFWICRKELVVQSLFVDGDMTFFLCAPDAFLTR